MELHNVRRLVVVQMSVKSDFWKKAEFSLFSGLLLDSMLTVLMPMLKNLGMKTHLWGTLATCSLPPSLSDTYSLMTIGGEKVKCKNKTKHRLVRVLNLSSGQYKTPHTSSLRGRRGSHDLCKKQVS